MDITQAPHLPDAPTAGSAFERYKGQIAQIAADVGTMPPVECPVKHHFADGIYARELFIPAGTVLVGKIHVTEHINILLSGEISVLTEDGPKRLVAPATLASQPGAQRVGFAHTDVIWTSIHHTHERDLDKIEAEVIATSFEDPRLASSPWKQEDLWLGQW